MQYAWLLLPDIERQNTENMKTNILTVVVACAAMLTARTVSASGTSIATPLVAVWASSSEDEVVSTNNLVSLNKARDLVVVSGAVAYGTGTPILLPATKTDLWSAMLGEDIRRRRSGLPFTNGANFNLTWSNTVASTTVPMWSGVLNPPAPFNNERGQVTWLFVDVFSKDGTDSVSLADISVTASSLTDGNLLGGTVTFGNASYTSLAIGIKTDGTVITNGVSSQKCARVMVAVLTPTFIANTQGELGTVQNWVNSYSKPSYVLKWVLQVAGVTSSYANVGTGGSTNQPTSPILSRNPFSLNIVSNGNPNYCYAAQSSTNVVDGWVTRGIVQGTNLASAVSVVNDRPVEFIRLEVLGTLP